MVTDGEARRLCHRSACRSVRNSIGAGGSFVGGLIGNLISGDGLSKVHSAGWIGSIIGAIVLMAILGRSR